MKNKKQNGNVLFLILIAVVLFAALSYAVTQSSRGGGSATSEKNMLTASQLFQYGTSLSTAIMRMQINGVADTEVCFYTGSNHADYNHAGCADDTNNVFHPDGGGATYQAPPAGIHDGTEWEFTARAQIWGQGSTTPGSPTADDVDLFMVIRDVNDDVCLAINQQVGLTSTPVDSGDLNVARFNGVYSGGVDNLDGCPSNCASLAVSPIASNNLNTGCFQENDTSENVFFYTLIAR